MAGGGSGIVSAVLAPITTLTTQALKPILGLQQQKEAKDARKAVEAESRRQEEDQRKLEEKAAAEEEEKKKRRAETISRKRKASIRAQKPRQRQTILTTPLGLTEEPTSAGRTVLGG